jgi:hypothetical protein
MENPEMPPGLLTAIGAYASFMLVVWVVLIVSQWKIYTKAGRPGWAALVPIYNVLVLLDVAGKPGYWLLLLMIPFANIYFGVATFIGLAERFGKDTGYAIGLLLLPFVFFPMLAFGSATFVGYRGLPGGAREQLPSQGSGSM